MKTKKSTLLSLATAAAIVATTFGTYAVWDTTSVEKEATVTIDKAVTMTVDTETVQFASSRTAGELTDVVPTSSGDVTFTVSDFPTEAEQTYNLEVTAIVYEKGTDTVATGVTAKAEKADTDQNTNIDGTHTYKVTVTPTVETPEDVTKFAQKTYDVKIKAEIVKKQQQA